MCRRIVSCQKKKRPALTFFGRYMRAFALHTRHVALQLNLCGFQLRSFFGIGTFLARYERCDIWMEQKERKENISNFGEGQENVRMTCSRT